MTGVLEENTNVFLIVNRFKKRQRTPTFKRLNTTL